MVALSPRLQVILNLINNTPAHKGTLADIGTDHAHLPIAAIQQGACNRAIACDLHPGPLSIANKNIQDAGLGHQIETRIGNGLQPLAPGEADCIVIAGMGGMRIWGILNEEMEQARAAKQLILQPQHSTVHLRKRLHEAGFDIQDEHLVRNTAGSKEYFYPILSVRYAAAVTPWAEREYYLGKHLIAKGGEDFSAFLAWERKKIETYISSIQDEAALSTARERLMWLAE